MARNQQQQSQPMGDHDTHDGLSTDEEIKPTQADITSGVETTESKGTSIEEPGDLERKIRLEALIQALDCDGNDNAPTQPDEPFTTESHLISTSPFSDSFPHHRPMPNSIQPAHEYASLPMERTWAASSVESSPALSLSDTSSFSGCSSPIVGQSPPHHHTQSHLDHHIGRISLRSGEDDDEDEGASVTFGSNHQGGGGLGWESRWAGIGRKADKEAKEEASEGLQLLFGNEGTLSKASGKGKGEAMTVGRAGGKKVRLGWI